MAVSLLILAAAIVVFWVLWFAHRSLVASANGPVYTGFENAFPLADGLLAMVMVLTALALWRSSRWALFGGLLSAGGGFYLVSMDTLFDLQHSIWSQGGNGIVELAINVVTLVASIGFARWFWTNRRRLDPSN